MPKKYIPKTDRKNKSHKVVAAPEKAQAKYAPLADLDNRTNFAKVLRAKFEQICLDVGGRETLGHIKAALVERFVWLEAILQKIERDMAEGRIERAESLGRWIQAVNSLCGLAGKLGINPKAQEMPWLTVIDVSDPKALADASSTDAPFSQEIPAGTAVEG